MDLHLGNGYPCYRSTWACGVLAASSRHFLGLPGRPKPEPTLCPVFGCRNALDGLLVTLTPFHHLLDGFRKRDLRRQVVNLFGGDYGYLDGQSRQGSERGGSDRREKPAGMRTRFSDRAEKRTGEPEGAPPVLLTLLTACCT